MISRPLKLPGDCGGNLDSWGITESIQYFSRRSVFDRAIIFSNGEVDLEDEFEDFSCYIFNHEYITLRDLLLDSNFRGGGISVINSFRITIDNCYIVHFTTNGILVHGSRDTYIRNSFLGQHITSDSDCDEEDFSGTAINLKMSKDNAVTDVIIFSAGIGIMVSGIANTLTRVHCYNKASHYGGIGICLRLPGLTVTHIVNCYMDYAGIVAEDPVQLHISNIYFLGDVFILFKSINGVIRGVNIVDNMFTGSNRGVDIVQLDQSEGPFKTIDQVVIDQNNVSGMNLKVTVARAVKEGNGSSWVIDFNYVLLFPNLVNHVQYTLSTTGSGSGSFPKHALRNVLENRVVVESDRPIQATVYVTVHQIPMSNGWTDLENHRKEEMKAQEGWKFRLPTGYTSNSN
ncbi:polygalacturonase QRT3-like [Macadamia integrifolia]|uniref:polygalacturonase QRT3-like n=1 Tax=Macadamia integrifolia TaxID=60698 RepID=UPI001C52F6E3|nr:polygalacturonase QRT3-like [Macadamia integrifolia]XP_042519615.1 polygalacturonase QRT3-like [Macadamia integrifolia]